MFGSKKLRQIYSKQKKNQAEKSYGNGFDMERFAEETVIKNSDGNNLIAKAKAIKVL